MNFLEFKNKRSPEQIRDGLRALSTQARTEADAAAYLSRHPGLTIGEDDFPALAKRANLRKCIAAKGDGWRAAEKELQLLETLHGSSIEEQTARLERLSGAQVAAPPPERLAPPPPPDPGIAARALFDVHVRKGEYAAAAALAVEHGLKIDPEELPHTKALQGAPSPAAVQLLRTRHADQIAGERELVETIASGRAARASASVATPMLDRLEEIKRTRPGEAAMFAGANRQVLNAERSARDEALEQAAVA